MMWDDFSQGLVYSDCVEMGAGCYADPSFDLTPMAGDAGLTDATHHSSAGNVRFGSWETWPSGYMYEVAPDGSYTGNWGT